MWCKSEVTLQVDSYSLNKRTIPVPSSPPRTALHVDPNPKLQRMGGPEDWVVKCVCGAVRDDGCRFIECDSCGKWFHTRCCGIPDSHPPPNTFFCHSCRMKTVAQGD